MTSSEPATASPMRPAPSGRGELALRVASALVLAPLAVVTAYLGGWWFIAVWMLAAVGVMWEWTRLVGNPARKRVVAASAAAFAAAALLLGNGRVEAAFAVLGVGVVAAAVLSPTGQRKWAAAGGAYAGAMLAAPVMLRHDADYGFVAILFLFAVVWLTDIAAYFAGRLVGGPKLWPAVSPKKTWAGAVGGLAAALAGGLIAAAWAGLDHRLAVAMVSLGLSVVAQVGDFSESALKRRFGAKDASRLIPGHGGLLDRLDGFWAAALAGTVLGVWRGGVHAPAQGLLIW